ncbi:hypothetical protein BFL34_00021 [Clavibacter michiganensis]|uniref:Glycosyltransferase n=1 Tax=Clavibacter michiganensis TaxID=28447 RepID=A0A251YE65_9MICO|nr:hypothetical protein [Clavibacter michiganensis]OUE22496.1 hypothetical protein BFL34_00021 [Clavibacter michiganensis]
MHVSPTLSIAIMAHPSRRESAESLASALGLSDDSIVYDPDPGGVPSGVRTARLAWGRASSRSTHHVVLQDDVTVPDGFLRSLEAAVASRPTSAIMLCSEWSTRTGQLARAAAFVGSAWAELSNSSLWAAGVVLPSEHAIAFADELRREEGERDSAALWRYASRSDLRIETPVPSLIQHDAHVQRSSWHRTSDQGPRRAAVFVERSSPASYSGGTETLRLDAIPYLPTDRLSAFVSRRSPSGSWELLRATDLEAGSDYIGRYGLTQESISAEFNASFPSFEAMGLVRHVGKAYLLQTWITALLLGESLRAAGHAETAAGPAADAAARTMVAGSLKRVLPADSIEELLQQEPSFVLDAVRRGQGGFFVAG